MEKYSIKLSLEDLRFLRENLSSNSLNEKISFLIESHAQKNQQAAFDFNEPEIEEIEDCLSDLLCLKGLNKNDEPNAFGYYIESLIDKFSVE